MESHIFLMIASFYVISMVLAQDGNQFVHYDFKKADLYVDGIATIEDGRLKLTNNSKRDTGHAFHKRPISFIKNTSFSFSTEFVFAIIPEEKTCCGQGMAFLISPSIDLRYGAATSFLGIFNRTNDNKTENHILAVELDTNESSESSDKSGNHVGIDINSIVSIYSVDASYFDKGRKKSLLLASKQRIHIWIEYDGEQRLLNVTLAPLETPKPSLPLLSRSIDISKIFKEQIYFGFSGSTGTIISTQYVLGWSLAIGGKAKSLDISKVLDLPRPPPPNHMPLILALAATIAFLIIACGIGYLYQQNRYAEVFEQWEREYCPQRFSFRTLYKATKGFKENRILGAGGFGKVYKGDLLDGTQIAVKRVSHGAEQGMQEYVSEIATMGRLAHRNLVQLRGYCRRKGELLLVYEYMPNGSLSDYLFNGNNLSWSQRVHILKGVSDALHYLHEGWAQVVLHRDIKASNILLDSNLNGKVGDFGLARFHERGMVLEPTRVVGTIGYMAPEVYTMGVANESTDVYAFGALILEVVCGRRPIDLERSPEEKILVEWVASCGREDRLMDSIDSKLAGNFKSEEAKLLLKLGMLCLQSDPQQRPTMKDITEYLDKEKNIPTITFDTTEIGIPIIPQISNEMGASQGTTSSLASFSYDTITMLFRGR